MQKGVLKMRKPAATYEIPLPRFVWLFLPILLLLYAHFAKMTGLIWETQRYREYGLIENATLLFLAIAVVYAVRIAVNAERPVQRAWFWVLAAGAFYFLGEEASWGQHIFSWHTPDALSALNEQKETNLHNLAGGYRLLFHNLPRQVMSFASILGGFVVPLYLLKSGKTFTPDSLHHWIWPSYACGVAGLMATLASQPVKIAHSLRLRIPDVFLIDYGEFKECLLALFILLYLMGAARYFLPQRQAVEAEEAEETVSFAE